MLRYARKAIKNRLCDTQDDLLCYAARKESIIIIHISVPTQTKASWIFGSLFAAFVLGVFIFGPPALPAYKQQILAYVCALLAGLFGLFFTGSLLVNAELPFLGKWVIQGGAGFGLFLVVLFWWQSPSALVQKEHIVSDDPPREEGRRVTKTKKSIPARAEDPAPPKMTTSEETYSSNPVASGACEGFGGWGSVCSADKPTGWKIASHSFALDGDRACGAYSECSQETANSAKVCYNFRTQGHNEECGHSGNTGIHYTKGVLTVTWLHPE